VTTLTDTSGVPVEYVRYDAFGKPALTDAYSFPRATSFYGNRLLFTGREYLPELAIYDYRNRQYLPELGRFLQLDPIRFEAGDNNLYRYVANNPVNLVDPLGLRYNYGGANVPVNERDLPNTDPSRLPPPKNSIDKCYQAHDWCIARCPDCQPQRFFCILKCDWALSSCLGRLGRAGHPDYGAYELAAETGMALAAGALWDLAVGNSNISRGGGGW